MLFSNRLRERQPSNTPAGRRSGFHPRLEALEDRCLPSTLTVTNNLDDGSVGSLRYEINKAHKGDTIVFAPSLDGQTIWLRGELDITKSLTIQGPGAGLLTINGGADGYDDAVGHRVLAVEKNTNVTVSGLTITGGDGILAPGYFSPYDNEGGGILNLGTLTVSGCTVTGNYANPASGNSYGGGIYNAGSLTVTNSIISNNSVNPDPTGFPLAGASIDGYGGGIYNAGAVTVTTSTVSGNFAETDGGGIYNAGTATVTNSRLSSNRCSSQGGGMYNSGTLIVDGCTVSNNSAYSGDGGGGIYNAGTLTVSNSAFSGNWIPVETAPNNNNIFGPYTDGGGNTFN